MKVQYTKTVSGPNPLICGNPGEKRDIPGKEAEALLKAGAVKFLEPVKKVKRATAPDTKTERR